MKVEEYSIVLDYLPKGRSTGFKAEPLAQVIGIEYFTLLEIVPKENADLKVGEKIYVGKDARDKVDHIKKRIDFNELTTNSVTELDKIVDLIISENEKKFVDFFNKSVAITIRRHQLELLPGLGKKHLFQILDERAKKPFDSFDEISKRISLMPNPKKLVAKRIIEELRGEDDQRHYIFARPPFQERQDFERPFERREFRREF